MNCELFCACYRTVYPSHYRLRLRPQAEPAQRPPSDLREHQHPRFPAHLKSTLSPLYLLFIPTPTFFDSVILFARAFRRFRLGSISWIYLYMVITRTIIYPPLHSILILFLQLQSQHKQPDKRTFPNSVLSFFLSLVYIKGPVY